MQQGKRINVNENNCSSINKERDTNINATYLSKRIMMK